MIHHVDTGSLLEEIARRLASSDEPALESTAAKAREIANRNVDDPNLFYSIARWCDRRIERLRWMHCARTWRGVQ